jgi:hypothetical protein
MPRSISWCRCSHSKFVNDLPGTLIQIRRALKPDGLLLAALVGGDTLIELRQGLRAAEVEIEDGVSPRVAPFSDVRDTGCAASAGGFRAAGSRRRPDDLHAIGSPFELMHDLRRMGATNPLVERSRRPLKARHTDADGGNLRGAFLRSGRSHQGYVRGRLALRLGTA